MVDVLCELFECCVFLYWWLLFGIVLVVVDDDMVLIVEEVVVVMLFVILLYFCKVWLVVCQLCVLIVVLMFGYFVMLLCGMVCMMLVDYDVYIIDWYNLCDILLVVGCFGFDEYVMYVIDFICYIGLDVYVLVICQLIVVLLVVVLLMVVGGDFVQFVSFMLMVGLIDCCVNLMKVNEFVMSQLIEWFVCNLISVVLMGFVGVQWCVYLGFVQVGVFMLMNLDCYVVLFVDLYYECVKGDFVKVDMLWYFYDEYFVMVDFIVEFYLEMVEKVFQQYVFVCGELVVGDMLVELVVIYCIVLLMIEGEKDDICVVGQMVVVQELCLGLLLYLKMYYVQMGVGYYGVFNGSWWEMQIYLIVWVMIYDNELYDCIVEV